MRWTTYTGKPIPLPNFAKREIRGLKIVEGYPESVSCIDCGGACIKERTMIHKKNKRGKHKTLWRCPTCITICI